MKLLSSLAKLMNQEVKGQYENSLVAVVIRATSLISILYYLFLAILFFLNGQYMIALYDFVGIMVLSYAAVLTYRNSTRLSYWVHGLSLLLLTIFQCIYVGWEIGFQYCFFVLVVITFFTTYYEFHYKLIRSEERRVGKEC